MARTKKQTLENASERKRQIQEEILRETLAAKQKKENLLSAQAPSHTKGSKSSVVAGGATAVTQNGLTTSGPSEGSFGVAGHRSKADNKDISGIFDSASSGRSHSSSMTSKTNPHVTSMNQGDLPKAVICIPDICRSPTITSEDEHYGYSSRESSPRGQGLRGRLSTDASAVAVNEETVRHRRESPKHSGRNLSSDVAASLKTLKAASEKIRHEKSKKSRQRSSSPSSNKSDSHSQKSSPERRSPRQHSPSSSSESHTSRSRHKKGTTNTKVRSGEKPRVNIFTDNLGVDLGKRIRSPRRMSEDMIALPIFSVRRWSSSPKESCSSSTGVVAKHGHDLSVSDGIESPSVSTNVPDESFKYPGSSPSPSRKSGSSGSPQKTPSPHKTLPPKTPSPCGSKSASLPGSPQKTPPSTGSKSGEPAIPPRKHRAVKSRENSPSGDQALPVPELQQKASEEKLSKLYPLRNSKPFVSRELELCPDTKSDNTVSGRDNDSDISKMSLDDVSNSETRDSVMSRDSDKSRDSVKSASRDSGSVQSHESASESGKKSARKAKKQKHKSKKREKIKIEVEELMSSICRELMTDVVISKKEGEASGDISQAAENPVKTEHHGDNDTPQIVILHHVKTEKSDSVPEKDNVSDSIPQTKSEEGSDVKTTLENSSVDMSMEKAPTDDVDEKPSSSLLCAMLVGGTEVANTYSQERERYKPHVVEISDSETEVSGQASLSEQGSKKPTDSVSSLKDASVKPITKKEPEFKSEISAASISALSSSKEQAMESDGSNTNEKSVCKDSGANSGTENKKYKVSEQVKGEDSQNLSMSEASKNSSDSGSLNVKKSAKLDFSCKLKKLDETVLKLIDIDVEEEFLKDMEVDEVSKVEHTENCETKDKENCACNETPLYGLISSLGSRLREADCVIPNATPVDIELVEKLIQSCPKGAPLVIPRLKLDARMEQIRKRLNEEELKDISPSKIKVSKSSDAHCNEDKSMTERDNTDCSGSKGGETVHSNNNISGDVKDVPESSASNNQEMDTKEGVTFGRRETGTPSLGNVPAGMTTSSSSLNDSLCDLDLDAMTSAVTDVVNLGFDKKGKDSGLKEQSLQAGLGPEADDITARHLEKNKTAPSNSSETSSKHSFQKSKTCDDFSEGASSSASSTPAVLRRVNSSPHLSARCPASPATSGCGKETHVKSKLGSKIPVPGTSYISKASKKTWRTPRVIVEPKPLSVLSELEESSSQPKNIFTCINLQKYLNIPSNRMIVPPEKKEQMKLVDAKAIEDEKHREIIRREHEEKERKNDEQVNAEYMKFEPDFDEVDGILFMSFSNEIELTAHVTVEKALEWDKDDTMLRISRAKAFEEAKAQNENMGDFKSKHLRGQHMRWKKYRRLYSCEVKALLDAKEKGVPYEKLITPKKTSDVTKIKGWKKKQSVISVEPKVNTKPVTATAEFSINDIKDEWFGENVCDPIHFAEDSMLDSSLDISPRSRSKRSQGFSHQKAHKQLFKELKMDWEDRMIHRKLGGWSLKGNRPRAFSRAAMKRQEKECREADPDGVSAEVKDISMDASNLEEPESEMTPEGKGQSEVTPEGKGQREVMPEGESQSEVTPDGKGQSEVTPDGKGQSEVTPDGKGQSEGPKKKKVAKIVYPLISEKTARNALRALVLGDIRRDYKRKRKRTSDGALPPLTPIPTANFPPTDKLPISDVPGTPHSTTATLGSSPAANISTSPSSQQQNKTQTPTPSSSSTVMTPLGLDLQDDVVMEGVDMVAGSISSPSLADSTSSKSCSKPGCRYGCICHLCSVSEASVPTPSPATKPATPVCDKEYCRLGCICDSIDPEKPIPNEPHCGKPTCMLQCVCSEAGSLDGNDDIPYLPSMKRRPKPGERFSNLPQRERTHRSAKNLDAITRKAMMLYETSEIYCEKVERVKKRPEATNSPSSTPLVSPIQASSVLPGSHIRVACAEETFDIDIDTEEVNEEEELMQGSNVPPGDFLCGSENTLKGEAGDDLASDPDFMPQVPARKRPSSKYKGTMYIIDDVRQTVPSVEPSAHKRKRKSHPLSGEIFSSSTCARTQPYRPHYSSVPAALEARDHGRDGITLDSSLKSEALANTHVDTGSIPENEELLLKIESVQTLASDAADASLSEDQKPLVLIKEDLAQLKGPELRIPERPTQVALGSNLGSGQSRHHHGWHTSMVCLKARAPPPSQPGVEEDIQEEDEVKLLEFAANCNWEGAKKEILAKVAQCLTRGQYPHPRTMNVCEFVVEILPKAHQPSVIPPELRSKLPGQMYSIRVRITRREMVSKNEDCSDVIDLSESSPVKSNKGTKPDASDSKSAKICLAETMTHAQNTSLPSSAPSSVASDSSYTASSVGISGLSKLCITSAPIVGQLNSSSQTISLNSLKPSSAPNSRRASSEYSSGDSLYCPEQMHLMDGLSATAETPSKHKLSFKKENSSALASLSSSIGSTTVTPSATSGVKLKLPSSGGAKHGGRNSKISTLSQPPLVTNTVHAMQPIIGPFNSKDVKYMKIPGKDGMMKVIEMGPSSDKNKKFLALAMDVKGKQGTVPVVVPLQAVSSQLKTGTSTTPPQQILLRFPGVPNSKAQPGTPVLFQPIQGTKGQPTRFQVVPLPVGSNVSVPQSKTASTSESVLLPKPTLSKAKTLNSNDEMIMVFDAAHIKASQLSKSSTSAPLSTPNNKDDEVSASSVTTQSISTSVTASRDRPIMSSEISPSKLQTQLNGAIDLTDENVALEDALNEEKNSDSKESSSQGLDECDGGSGILEENDADEKSNDLKAVDNGEDNKCEVSAAVECSDIPKVDCNEDISPNQKPVSEENLTSVSSEHNKNGDGNAVHAATSTTSLLSEAASNDFSKAEAALKSPEVIDLLSNSANSTASTSPQSFTTANESKSQYGSALTGSKRSLPISPLEGEPHSPCPKRPCLSNENPVLQDEDSNISINSVSGGRMATAGSSQDGVDRPKSVMSMSMSTGSSEDLMILLSSEEEIDVGENEIPENMMAYRELAERALENDHGSMCSRGDPLAVPLPQISRYEIKVGKEKGRRRSSRWRKTSDHLQHHNQLERMRRSKLKKLFEELQAHVMRERNLSGDVVMSKVKVLHEAKRLVLELTRSAHEGDLQIKTIERENRDLILQLAKLKEDMLDNNVSADTIEAILEKASIMKSRSPSHPVDLDDVDPDPEEPVDTINLLSPSTDGDKNSSSPVYEDISDPEDASAPKYEDISEPEEAEGKYEDISDS